MPGVFVMSIDQLYSHLYQCIPGEIEGDCRKITIDLLSACWTDLQGSSEESTWPEKLWRAEVITWNPPKLTFMLERHGATVNQSSRAALHYWEVDILNRTAKIAKRGQRQLTPMSPRLNTQALAEEIANLILENKQNDLLSWITDSSHVVINIGKVIPMSNEQTTASRRKRFRTQLESIMSAHGWARKDKGNKIGFSKPPANT